jgi:uncharacterized protein (TIRG00374 family)
MRHAARRTVQSFLLLAFGLAVLATTVHLFGTERVAERLATADRSLLAWAAVVFFSQFFTMGLRWWLTMRLLGHEVRILPLFRANAASNFVNFFAPGHFGEPMIAAWLERSGRAPGVHAFSALIGSKVLATILSFALLVACIPLLASRTEASWLIQVAGTAVALGLGTCVALLILLRPAVAAQCASLLGRLVRGSVGRLKPELGERLASTLESLARQVRDSLALFGKHPRALVGSAAISTVKVALQVLFVVLLFAAFGQDLTVAGATFLVTVDVLQNAISIWIPANLGVQEALLVAAAAGGLSIDGSIAASAAIAHKAILLVHVALGGIAFLVLGWFDPAPTEDD